MGNSNREFIGGPVTDEEARQIMYDGGVKLCEDAVQKWVMGRYNYGNTEKEMEMAQDHVARWREVQRRIKNNGKEWLGMEKPKRKAKP